MPNAAANLTQGQGNRPEPDEHPEVYRLPRVEYFATGTHGGETWTKRDLDEIARNHRKFRGKLDPPLVVGHEEDQDLLDATNVPAAGWPDDLRVEWDPEDREWKLVGPAEGVPPEVADWIDRGLYRKVSAEIYDDSGEAGLPPGHGKMLRRVALLGGELPKVKIIRSLPKPERSKQAKSLPFAETGGRTALRYSETRRSGTSRRVTFFAERRFGETPMNGSAAAMWAQVDDVDGKLKSGRYNRKDMKDAWHTKMSESNPMDRNQLASAALASGIPQSVIDKLDDQELAAVTQAKAPINPAPTGGGGNFAEGDMPEPPAPEPEEGPGQYGNYAEEDLDPDPTPGGDNDADDMPPSTTMGERCTPGTPSGSRNFSDEDPSGTGQSRPKSPPAAPADDQADRTNGQVAKMYSEMQRLYRTYTRQLGGRVKAEAKRARAAKADTVKRYCEKWQAEKKVLPFEIDPKGPRHNLFHRLMTASTQRVHKFSEKGKRFRQSDFDLLVASVDARDGKQHVRFFSEKMAQKDTAGANSGLSPERRKELLSKTPLGDAIAKGTKAKL